jgi:tetratricopeptide (TPR) repeat protein
MRLYTLLFNILALFLVSACSKQAINSIEKTINKTENELATMSYEDGIKLEKSGKDHHALKAFDMAISYKHDYKEAWMHKIELLKKMGKKKEAMDAEKQMHYEMLKAKEMSKANTHNMMKKGVKNKSSVAPITMYQGNNSPASVK